MSLSCDQSLPTTISWYLTIGFTNHIKLGSCYHHHQGSSDHYNLLYEDHQCDQKRKEMGRGGDLCDLFQALGVGEEVYASLQFEKCFIKIYGVKYHVKFYKGFPISLKIFSSC